MGRSFSCPTSEPIANQPSGIRIMFGLRDGIDFGSARLARVTMAYPAAVVVKLACRAKSGRPLQYHCPETAGSPQCPPLLDRRKTLYFPASPHPTPTPESPHGTLPAVPSVQSVLHRGYPFSRTPGRTLRTSPFRWPRESHRSLYGRIRPRSAVLSLGKRASRFP